MGVRNKQPTGWVNFPTGYTFGDPGTFVVAVVLEEGFEDPFIHCCDCPNIFVEEHSEDALTGRLLFDKPDDGGSDDAALAPFDRMSYMSRPVLAAVLLGTIGRGFYDEVKGENWVCSRLDLTREGLLLVELLECLYGRPVHLATFIDT